MKNYAIIFIIDDFLCMVYNIQNLNLYVPYEFNVNSCEILFMLY